MKKIIIINGPNLNLLGKREPEIYGKISMEDYIIKLKQDFTNIALDYYQSNVEGELINKIQEVGFDYDGIIINAGGYSHTSVALHDALKSVNTPAIEVHISNIFAREEYRHHSLLSNACIGAIIGLGMEGYRYAIEAIINQTN